MIERLRPLATFDNREAADEMAPVLAASGQRSGRGCAMIECLRRWYEAHHAALRNAGLSSQFTSGPADHDKRAVWVDVESDTALVRLTLWDTGECVVESAVLTDEHPAVEHLTLGTCDEVEQALARLLDGL